MSRTISVVGELAYTPDSKNESQAVCPLKRSYSAEYNADEEDQNEDCETEKKSPLAPKKLNFEQQVSFGDEQDDKSEKDDDEVVPTQKYEPSEELEEGELQQPVAPTLSSAENLG